MVSGDVIVVPNNTRLRGAGSALTIIRSGTMNVRTWDNQPDDDDLPKRPPGAGQRLWNVPTVFCNALYLSPGPFAAPSTTPALQTDHDISIEGIGFDSARVSEPATLRFLLARRLKFNDLRFFNSGAGAWGGGGIGLIGCDEVGIRDCDIPASTNPIDCWQGCTRVKISDCVLGAYDHGAVVNGGLINWNGGGTVTPQTQSSNDLQVSDCTFWLRNTMAMFLDSMSSGCSSHTHVISGCRIHAAVGTANNLGIVGRGLGGNTKIHDCTFSAAPGQTISAPILFSGFYGAVGQYVAGGIVSTTAGSPNFTVSVPNGTDVGPGNYCMIDNNAGGPVVGNGMSLNGWYLVLSVSGTTSDSSTGTLLTCRGPNNATATGVIAGTTRQQGYLGTFKGCQITDITFDGVGYAGNYLIDLGGGGHRVDGVTVTQNYYGGSPQYLAIVQFDSTQDFGNPNIPRVQIDNIIGAAGIGSLPGGWAGDNRITWQPYSTQPDLPVWNLNGNGGLLVGGFVWGQAGPLPTPPANGLLVMGPVQLAAVATGASYATDAAAAAGGVELHTAYRNGSALMVRVT
jgi:hypothetical protein